MPVEFRRGPMQSGVSANRSKSRYTDYPKTPLYNDKMNHMGYDDSQRFTKPMLPLDQLPDGSEDPIIRLPDYDDEVKRHAYYTEVHFRDGSVGTYGPHGERVLLDRTNQIHPDYRDPKYGMMHWDDSGKVYLPTRQYPRDAPVAPRNQYADSLSGMSDPELYNYVFGAMGQGASDEISKLPWERRRSLRVAWQRLGWGH